MTVQYLFLSGTQCVDFCGSKLMEPCFSYLRIKILFAVFLVPFLLNGVTAHGVISKQADL